MRKRPTLTVKELVKYLKKVNPDAKVYLAPAVVNFDEPEATQEFILHEEKIKCVCFEHAMPSMIAKEVVFGWASK
jgi:hypothetical protein